MTFYDFSMSVAPNSGVETYTLRSHGAPFPGYCRINVYPDGTITRKTSRGTNGSIRYAGYFANLDAALASGIAWAKRNEREAAREAARDRAWHEQTRAMLAAKTS